MKVTKEQVEKNIVQLEISVEAQEFEAAMEKSYKKNVSKMMIQGFRKGKAPRKMIEKQYGEAVFYEDAIEFAFQDTYPQAIEQEGLEPVDRPDVEIKQIGSDKDFIYIAKVTVKPEVELGEYMGISVDKIDYPVTDEEVNGEINQMMERAARIVEMPERVIEHGDIAVIDFEGFVGDVAFEGGKGENHSLTIGSGQFIPGFEEQLIGAKSGDSVDVNVKFPQDYNAEELADKDALFKVKIQNVKVKEYPALDDDFAKDVSEYDTLEQLKEETKKRLEADAALKVQRETEDAVIGKVVENATVEIPPIMVEHQIDELLKDTEYRMSMQGINLNQYLQYTGGTLEQMKDSMRERAEKHVKTTLVLKAIAEKEEIVANEEDIEAEIAKMAEQYKMEADKVKELLGEKGAENIKGDVAITKTIQKLLSSAQAV